MPTPRRTRPPAPPPARGCRVPSAPGPVGPAWRLTDRGVAAVLVIAAMIMMAALAVIVPTAIRVTGVTYQPYGTSELVKR